MSISQDARDAGLQPNTVYRRIGRGTPQEDWFKPVTNLRQQAQESGINYSTLRQRIALGWNIDRALNAPVSLTGQKYYRLNSQTYTIEELEILSGIRREILSHRINSLGWNIGRALTVPVRKRKHLTMM